MFRAVTSLGRNSLRTGPTIRGSLPRNQLRTRRPSQPSSSLSSFSTFAPRRGKQNGPSQRAGDQPPNTNPDLPAFSLDGLGMSKNMKRVLVGLICIFGTMETYTYYRWIKNWYYGEGKDSEGTVES